MPLIAKACLAYALGLFAVIALPAPLGALTLAIALCAGAVLFAARSSRQSRDLMLCAVLYAGGALVATADRRAAAGCAARLEHAASIRVLMEDDARAGGMSHARVRETGCDLPVVLFVDEGAGRAGDAVSARGALSTGDRGLVLRDARISGAAPEARLAAFRATVGRRIDRLFGDDAPMVRALVIADMSAIPAEQRDRFARAGLVHMLSVSGLHVAIVALALALLASALRLPRVPSQVGTLAFLAAYVALIGAPPPAVRAAVMLALVLVSRAVQRPTSKWAVLAVGSVIPLVDPMTVVDLGWQLSVAGAIALVAGGALARRVIPSPWRGMRRNLATAAVVSVVATVVTAPLVAWTFGRIALVGPVTNLIADPVMGVLQPVLFLAMLSPPGLAELFAGGAHVLLFLFDAIATRAAAIPFAAPSVLPSLVAALAGGMVAVAVVVACLAREPMRPLLVALAACATMVVEPLLRPVGRFTELHMIDVGQGDALAIRTRHGRWIAIDAGRSWDGGDAGRSVVVPYLSRRGGELSAFILSHPHADHVGGAASILDALHPSLFVDPGYVGTTPPYRAALHAAARDGIPWRRVHPGDSLVVDEVVITMLAPDSAWASGLADANLASTVAVVRVGAVRMLFTGDAEGPEEEWLLTHAADALHADVLKVGHHGSTTSTTPRFLEAVHPRVALVSVGAQNRYGHPSPDVMRRLRSTGAQVLRTDRLGSVVVRTDGHAIAIETAGVSWAIGGAPM